MATIQERTPRPCSVASALEVIGERWSLLVLREAHYGVHRFEAIQRSIGAPRDVLTKRLKRLVEAGVLERRQYSEHPPRFEYHPTQAGHELRSVLALLNAWGARWTPDAPQTDVSFQHDCGHELEPMLSCKACGRPVTGTDITVRAPELATGAPAAS
jgi:DNA-binding HxlR family transcriptional regulator